MGDFIPPLSIFFIWHPSDCEKVEPIIEECFACLSRDVNRPFSRSVNIPIFLRSSLNGGIPSEIVANSRRTLAFPFIGQNCIGDDGWFKYLNELGASEENDVVPLALDDTAFNFKGGMSELNFIRTFEFEEELFEDKTCLAIYHEIYRHGLNETHSELKHGQESSVKLFLSHAKDGSSGELLSESLKEFIDSGQMQNFFDATDIAPGYNFETEILRNLSTSTLVAMHSDSYSTRYWCQREIVAAKDLDRPIIAVDLIDEFEDRRFPIGANIPSVRIQLADNSYFTDNHLLQILQSALLETIRFFYSRKLLLAYRDSDWFPENAHISSRPPEGMTLAKLASNHEEGSDFVYPDPPIYQEELMHIEYPNLSVYTPLTSTKVEIDQKKIGISISEPNAAELSLRGISDEHLILLLQDISRYLLGFGAELVYGGDLRPRGFTEVLFEEGQIMQSRLKTLDVKLTNHIAWPIYLKSSTEMKSWKAENRGVAEIITHSLPQHLAKLVDSADKYLEPSDALSSFVWSESLSSMRTTMIESCDFRIAGGGKLSGYRGWMPGVLEECVIALKQEIPLFLLGGFGGVVNRICSSISDSDLAEELSLSWQLENNSGLREKIDFGSKQGIDCEGKYAELEEQLLNSDLRNGLSQEENDELFSTPFIDEAINLVVKGLARLGS